MNTLEELGLSNKLTFNIADYINVCEKYCCCGWMDVHEDSQNLGAKKDPIFVCEPLYWHKSGVFCIFQDGEWQFLTKSQFENGAKVNGVEIEGNVFKFDARLYHAFVHESIIPMLQRHRSIDTLLNEDDEYKSFVRDCEKRQSPKLVWKFHG